MRLVVDRHPVAASLVAELSGSQNSRGHYAASGSERHTAVSPGEEATLPQGRRAPQVEARLLAREREAAIRARGRIAERTSYPLTATTPATAASDISRTPSR